MKRNHLHILGWSLLGAGTLGLGVVMDVREVAKNKEDAKRIDQIVNVVKTNIEHGKDSTFLDSYQYPQKISGDTISNALVNSAIDTLYRLKGEENIVIKAGMDRYYKQNGSLVEKPYIVAKNLNQKNKGK